ncbi:hypothetical protein R1sor_006125 [Riccia sorocarpa]|uniref:Small RNA 2'-O-methyltransferase n=1 Tax=Riccia sorocarpa TaxID=122646 RepID=A0ABD3HQ63_9MARC
MTTPKAKLYQIYPQGAGVKFDTVAVQSASEENTDSLPGSTAFFKSPQSLQFRSTLTLPDGVTVVSDVFSRKKDAEQHASKQALEQLSVQIAKAPEVLTTDEKWESLRSRIVASFTDKGAINYHPLRQHFKAAVRLEGFRYGQVPMSALVALDTKMNSLCKLIDRKAETSPAYAIALLCKAASTCPSIKIDTDTFCISREDPFPAEIEEELLKTRRFDEELPDSPDAEVTETALRFRAVHLPCSVNSPAFASDLVVKPGEYYMDVIARELGVKCGGKILMSRPVQKTHPSTRLYWSAPSHLPQLQVSDSDLVNLTGEDGAGSVVIDEDLRRYSVKQKEEDTWGLHCPKNVRASLLVGYTVCGDVVLAAVGGDWTSSGKLYATDVTTSTFYRMMLQRFPQGSFKVSRNSILAAKLPTTYSSKAQWKGTAPRGLLIEFCQHHRLSEPVFTLTAARSSSTDQQTDQMEEAKEQKSEHVPCGDVCETKNDDENTVAAMHGGPFTCKVRVEWLKGMSAEVESDGPFRNRHDAQQSAALKALHQIDSWFENSIAGTYEPLFTDKTDGEVDGDLLMGDYDDVVGLETRDCWETDDTDFFEYEEPEDSTQIDKAPPAGSTVTIRYAVRWYGDADGGKKPLSILLEKHDKFDVELGNGALIGALDTLVSKMTVGELACVTIASPPRALLSALATDLGDKRDEVLSGGGSTRYTVRLLKFVEAPEERMEAAHFKPSLSKQRVDYALRIIEELQAKSLIDLGCGSGSLLESLLEQPTELKKLVGVDISHKSLIRAAKLLTQKLKNEKMPGKKSLESIDLYEGSITESDSRLRDADVAVCIEVVEHMDPEPLEKFGSVVLGMLQPKVLIVSTPNFEYNPILQGLPWDPLTNSLRKPVAVDVQQSEGKKLRLSEHHPLDGKLKASPLKFRNEDHRFEWTRAEFQDWASNMAAEYCYDVKFSGVGGTGEEDGPGFASQIALFSRKCELAKLAHCPTPQQPLANRFHHSNGHTQESSCHDKAQAANTEQQQQPPQPQATYCCEDPLKLTNDRNYDAQVAEPKLRPFSNGCLSTSEVTQEGHLKLWHWSSGSEGICSAMQS